MTDIPYPTDSERLRENIRGELQAQRAMRDLDLDDATLDGLTAAITANVDYGFSVKWQPRWVRGNEPHRWTEPPGDAPAKWIVRRSTGLFLGRIPAPIHTGCSPGLGEVGAGGT